jgi:hypothetical protein
MVFDLAIEMESHFGELHLEVIINLRILVWFRNAEDYFV